MLKNKTYSLATKKTRILCKRTKKKYKNFALTLPKSLNEQIDLIPHFTEDLTPKKCVCCTS